MDKDFIIKFIEWGLKKKTFFLEDVRKEFSEEEYLFVYNSIMSYDASGIAIPVDDFLTSEGNRKYMISSQARFNYLDYLELKEARRSSKSARNEAKWAILFAGFSALITFFTLLIALNSLHIQKETSASNLPDLEILLGGDNDKFFKDSQVVQLFHNESWFFWYQGFEMDLVVRNNGKGEVGDLDVTLVDPSSLFRSSYGGFLNIAPFGDEFLHMRVKHRDCFGGESEEEYKQIKLEGCNESSVDIGLREFYLILDCASCKEQKQCYSLNICIYNGTLGKTWCKDNFDEKDFDPEEIDCSILDDLYY